MRVRVTWVRPFRDAVGEAKSEVEGTPSLHGTILALVERWPGLGEHLLEDGALSPYVNIYRNGAVVHVDEAHEVTLQEGDELMFLLPMTGG